MVALYGGLIFHLDRWSTLGYVWQPFLSLLWVWIFQQAGLLRNLFGPLLFLLRQLFIVQP